MYEVESGIPRPTPGKKWRENAKYPFHKMEVGDSFTVDSARARDNVLSAANSYRCTQQGRGTRFSSKKIDNFTWRIWRDA